MQYLLLIYGEEHAQDDTMAEASEAERAAGMKEWFDYTDWLDEKEHVGCFCS